MTDAGSSSEEAVSLPEMGSSGQVMANSAMSTTLRKKLGTASKAVRTLTGIRRSRPLRPAAA